MALLHGGAPAGLADAGVRRLHADQLVYGDGLNLSTAAPATPVGPTCWLCVRRDCASRQQAPHHRRLRPDARMPG